MIRYGLKLWSNNQEWFAEAAELCASQVFDFVELYHNPTEPLDYIQLELLKPFVRAIHNPHSHGWHEGFISSDEQLVQWEETKRLADWCSAAFIIVHPSRSHTVAQFLENVKKISDPRMIAENMAGRDITNVEMGCAHTLSDLNIISATLPICFDIEKAAKAAVYHQTDPVESIAEAVLALQPTYFQISGADISNPVDEHKNLIESNWPLRPIKDMLTAYGAERELFLSFETPKQGGNLQNDVANLAYFKQL